MSALVKSLPSYECVWGHSCYICTKYPLDSWSSG